MIAIFKKELSVFLNTLIGPLTICVFLLINGLLLWSDISRFNLLESTFITLNSFFSLTPVLFILFIPAVSMRVFTEEYTSFTIETIITKPISPKSIVYGKILAVFCIILLSILPTLIYIITNFVIAENNSDIDYSGILGSYIGLIMIALSFSSIGVFASANSKNQIISLFISVSIASFLFFGFNFLSNMDIFKSIAHSIEKIGFLYHYNILSKGLLHFSSIFYFGSIAYIFSILSIYKINKLDV